MNTVHRNIRSRLSALLPLIAGLSIISPAKAEWPTGYGLFYYPCAGPERTYVFTAACVWVIGGETFIFSRTWAAEWVDATTSTYCLEDAGCIWGQPASSTNDPCEVTIMSYHYECPTAPGLPIPGDWGAFYRERVYPDAITQTCGFENP
jgi:hypothetical protein